MEMIHSFGWFLEVASGVVLRPARISVSKSLPHNALIQKDVKSGMIRSGVWVMVELVRVPRGSRPGLSGTAQDRPGSRLRGSNNQPRRQVSSDGGAIESGGLDAWWAVRRLAGANQWPPRRSPGPKLGCWRVLALLPESAHPVGEPLLQFGRQRAGGPERRPAGVGADVARPASPKRTQARLVKRRLFIRFRI